MPTLRCKYGLLTARMFVEMFRAVSEEFFGAEGAVASADLSLLGAALFIGQLEGRLMTATKIASYIGMPRATAIRKLQAMAAEGVAVQEGKRWRLATERMEIDQRADAIMQRHLLILRKASTELSKLDDVAIARRK